MRQALGRLGTAVAVVTLVTGLASANVSAQADGTGAPSDVPTGTASLLAVVHASGGTFAGGRLTLKGVAPDSTWFTDRPERRAGLLGIPELGPLFFHDQSAPNAALVFAGAAPSADVAVVELSKPRYDGRKHRLTFEAKTVDDPAELDQSSGLAGLAARNDGRIAKSFDEVSLFLDDAVQSFEQCPAQWKSWFPPNKAPATVTVFGISCADTLAVTKQTSLNGVECTPPPPPPPAEPPLPTWDCQVKLPGMGSLLDITNQDAQEIRASLSF